MKNSIPKKFKKSIEYESKIKKINFLDGHISYKSFNLANNEDVAILIHGTGAHKHWWDPLAPQISDIGTIIVPDLPGICLLYTSPSPRDTDKSRMPSSA